MLRFLAVLILLLAAPAAAAAEPHVAVIYEHRDAFPYPGGRLVEGPTPLQASACASGPLAGDTVHEGDLSAAKFVAVEAVPADREPDPAVRDAIAAIVADVTAHVARQPASRRTLRFDVGTACGPDGVDVHSLKLPRTAAEYQEQCTTQVFDDVRRALPPAPGPRNTILFSSTFDCGLILGFADAPKDDRPGRDNLANRGGYMAITFDLDARTALHEIGHTIGAVQTSAPHSDQNAHCYDNDDTMCYAYTAAVPVQTPLLRPCVADPQPFDCGQDDYFSPSPAPGSYLASHWNTYDSIFMCEAGSCVPPPAVPAAPVAPAPAAAPAQPAAKKKATARKKKKKRKRSRSRSRRR